MKKILFIIGLFYSLGLIAEDTIVTYDKVISCQMYAIEQTKLRYRENGIGKIINIHDIIYCSQPWKRSVDSINGVALAVMNTPKILKRYLTQACNDTAKTCVIMALELGRLTEWNISLDRILFNALFKAEVGALVITADYNQNNIYSLMTPATFMAPYKDGHTKMDALRCVVYFMLSKGWKLTDMNLNTEQGGEFVFHYLFKRK